MDAPEPPADTSVRECPHRRRRRDVYSGFAAAETVCIDCVQSFDPEREDELRARDKASNVGPKRERDTVVG